MKIVALIEIIFMFSVGSSHSQPVDYRHNEDPVIPEFNARHPSIQTASSLNAKRQPSIDRFIHRRPMTRVSFREVAKRYHEEMLMKHHQSNEVPLVQSPWEFRHVVDVPIGSIIHQREHQYLSRTAPSTLGSDDLVSVDIKSSGHRWGSNAEYDGQYAYTSDHRKLSGYNYEHEQDSYAHSLMGSLLRDIDNDPALVSRSRPRRVSSFGRQSSVASSTMRHSSTGSEPEIFRMDSLN